MQTTLPCLLVRLREYRQRILMASCHRARPCQRPHLRLPYRVPCKTWSIKQLITYLHLSPHTSVHSVHFRSLRYYFIPYPSLRSFRVQHNFIYKKKKEKYYKYFLFYSFIVSSSSAPFISFATSSVSCLLHLLILLTLRICILQLRQHQCI